MIALIGKADHVVADEYIHRGLKDGIYGSRTEGHIIQVRHHDYAQMEAEVSRLRKLDSTKSIIVVVHDLYLQDSSFTDLRRVHQICTKYNAILSIDTCETAFMFGENGHSRLKEQIDDFNYVFLIGSGSKALASNFGFMVVAHEGFNKYMRYYSPSLTFSNAIPPATSNVAMYNIDIASSKEGQLLRDQLKENSAVLRTLLNSAGFNVQGTESLPFVNIEVGCHLLARVICNLALQHGVAINVVEFPEVPIDRSLIRFNVQAAHTPELLKKGVDAFKVTFEKAKQYMETSQDAQLAKAALHSLKPRL